MIRSVSPAARTLPRHFVWLLLAMVALAAPTARAELAPTARDSNVTKIVLNLMKDDHLLRHPLDDEIAGRFLNTFLKMLDPPKVYFYQSDIDRFKAQETQLDDQIKEGDVRFSFDVFKTLLERIDERVKLVDELLAMDHDFTADEDLVIDSKLASYPKNAAEARDVWRKRIKYDLLVLKAEQADRARAAAKGNNKEEVAPPTKEDPRARLSRKYHNFAKRMRQTDHDELLEMYLSALTASYDPHSSYMSPSTLVNFEIMMRLNLEGIGAQLQYDDGYTVVKALIPGGAADKDGRLKLEDRIVGVGQGAEGALVDVSEMKLGDVVDMIRGKRDTVVRLQVLSVGQTDRKIYNITREQIKLVDQEARAIIIDQNIEGQTFRIGVIDLPSFYMDMEAARRGLPGFKSTTRDVSRLLADFRAKKVDAVLLDLRRNGGGSLSEAISLTGLFIDEGPIVQVKDKDDRVQQYDDLDQGAAWEGPLVVLTSKFSASASEIFAGAVQDYRRGIIVGDRSTHGKGTVQSLMDIGGKLFGTAGELGALKITMQQFYRPNGDSTQNRGVLADIELPSLTTHYDVGESDLDHALDFNRIDAVPYKKAGLVDEGLIGRLGELSLKRRKESSDFEKLLAKIERFQEQKKRKAITLNEARYLAERAEVNAEKEEEEQLDELNNNTKRPVFDTSSFYNQEALAITGDYLRLMKVTPSAVAGGRLGLPAAN
ncbi:MAG: carboxy terminal-processing peptidase [Pirellulales bacterium]